MKCVNVRTRQRQTKNDRNWKVRIKCLLDLVVNCTKIEGSIKCGSTKLEHTHNTKVTKAHTPHFSILIYNVYHKRNCSNTILLLVHGMVNNVPLNFHSTFLLKVLNNNNNNNKNLLPDLLVIETYAFDCNQFQYCDMVVYCRIEVDSIECHRTIALWLNCLSHHWTQLLEYCLAK